MTTLTGQPLALTAEEIAFLRDLLGSALRETQIEAHRTRTINYREWVLQKEDLIRSLLEKLGRQANFEQG